jgi:hypothetical protein
MLFSICCSDVTAEGSQPGDLVHLDGSTAPASYPTVVKLDEWRKVVPGLVVAAGGKVRGGSMIQCGGPHCWSCGHSLLQDMCWARQGLRSAVGVSRREHASASHTGCIKSFTFATIWQVTMEH